MATYCAAHTSSIGLVEVIPPAVEEKEAPARVAPAVDRATSTGSSFDQVANSSGLPQPSISEWMLSPGLRLT